MTDEEIRALLLELICDIAPEVDPGLALASEDIRETFDLDSMDFANLIVALHNRTGADIPERDYSKLFTIGNAVAYLQDALARTKPRA